MDYGAIFMQWIVNPMIWIFIILFAVGMIVLGLVIRRKKRLKLQCLEVIKLQNGRTAFLLKKAGWFGKNLYAKGLWWTGDQVLYNEDRERIHEFSTEDYTEINGQRGLIAYRSPSDQDILVPISKVNIDKENLVLEIAPASFRDVATDLIRDAAVETTDWKDRVLQAATWGLLIIIGMITIMFIIQFARTQLDKITELTVQNQQACLSAAKDICSNIVQTAINVKSNAP